MFPRLTTDLIPCQGIDAQLISLNDIVAEAYGTDLYKQTTAYDSLGARFFHALANRIGERLEACENKVPVVTGRQIAMIACCPLLTRTLRIFWNDAIFPSPECWTWLF